MLTLSDFRTSTSPCILPSNSLHSRCWENKCFSISLPTAVPQLPRWNLRLAFREARHIRGVLYKKKIKSPVIHRAGLKLCERLKLFHQQQQADLSICKLRADSHLLLQFSVFWVKTKTTQNAEEMSTFWFKDQFYVNVKTVSVKSEKSAEQITLSTKSGSYTMLSSDFNTTQFWEFPAFLSVGIPCSFFG